MPFHVVDALYKTETDAFSHKVAILAEILNNAWLYRYVDICIVMSTCWIKSTIQTDKSIGDSKDLRNQCTYEALTSFTINLAYVDV